MSLREITKDLHHEAELTKFAKLLLSGKIESHDYANYLFQLIMIYSIIESGNRDQGFLTNLPGLERINGIREDFKELVPGEHEFVFLPATLEYSRYLNQLLRDPERKHLVKAHLYCRHMGDLFGGQIIKKQVAHISSGKFYDFENADSMKTAIRETLTDDLGDEARVAFEYAIMMMRDLYRGE